VADSLSGTLTRYLSSKLVSQILGAGIGFLRPRLLSPELFGLWTLLKLIPQYAGYAHLGTRTALRVFYPWHLARGDREQAQALVSGGILGAMLIDTLLASAIITLALIGNWSDLVRFGLLAMAALVVLQGWRDSMFAALKASHRFDVIARAYYVEATTLFLTTLILLPTLGIYGLFLSVLLSEFLVAVYLGLRAGVALQWSRRIVVIMGSMIRRGWPIMSLELAMMLVITTDRFVVSAMLDTTALGYYGVALMIVSFLRNVPGTAREVLEPRLMADLAGTERPALLRRHLLEPALNAAFLMPLIIGPVALAAPLIIEWLLPGYQPAAAPTQILACGVYFLALSLVLRSPVVALGRQRRAAALMPLIVLANLLTAWVALRLGAGLAGVAAASGVAFLLLFLTLWRLLRPELAATPREERRQLIWIWPLFLLTALLIWQLPALITDAGLLGTGLRILVFIASFLLLHWLAQGRLNLLSPLPLEVLEHLFRALQVGRRNKAHQSSRLLADKQKSL
jgi:O-antigen/teichoic acid export membrane protein